MLVIIVIIASFVALFHLCTPSSPSSPSAVPSYCLDIGILVPHPTQLYPYPFMLGMWYLRSSPKSSSEKGSLRFSPEVLQQHEDRMANNSTTTTSTSTLRRTGSNSSFHPAHNPEELLE